MAELIGRMLDRYEIVDLLGAGGMGAVYRARDGQLGREVAVKVLAEDIAQNQPSLERFSREARTVAKLSHPNILAIHDFGTADGTTFAVMELLDGLDLRSYMHRKPLTPHRALEIVAAVADGLGAAHAKGIVHRDVKPENIFVTTDGGVKVLDFGLARDRRRSETPDAVTETFESRLTREGTIIGTTAYMSPEQARGQDLDGRSDIFSLGCVLYELLTGKHPFSRATRVDSLSAILNDDPPPVSSVTDGLPPAIDGIIDRCLKKDRDLRFESARDVAYALRALSDSAVVAPLVTSKGPSRSRIPRLVWITALSAAILAVLAGVIADTIAGRRLPEELRLAVMRFESDSDKLEDRQAAAGLTELVAYGLREIDLNSDKLGWVVPRRSADHLDLSDIPSVTRTINVNMVIEGRLHRTENQLRLVLWATDPQTGRRVRRVEIDDALENLSAFQFQPAFRVAEMLGLQVDSVARNRLERTGTNVIAAFEGHLQGTGMLALESGSLADIEAAVEVLRQAAADDPVFEPARLELARGCLVAYRHSEEREWIERGLSEAGLAVELEAASTEAFLVKAELHSAAGEEDRALETLEHAVSLSPDNAEAHLRLGRVLESLGRLDEAEAQYQRAIYLRPGFWPDHHWLAELYSAQGRYDAAVTQYRRVVELAPLYDGGYNNLGTMFLFLDRNSEAIEVFEQSVEVEPEGNFYAFANLGTVYFAESRFADAAQMFERAVAIKADEHWLWGNLGYAYQSGIDPGRAESPFRRAIKLAEEDLRRSTQENPQLLAVLAGYYAAVGDSERGVALVERAAAAGSKDPQVVAGITEAFEDLGERDRALEWVRNAFELGVAPSWFERRPSLRNLLADERYRRLAIEYTGLEIPTEKGD